MGPSRGVVGVLALILVGGLAAAAIAATAASDVAGPSPRPARTTPTVKVTGAGGTFHPDAEPSPSASPSPSRIVAAEVARIGQPINVEASPAKTKETPAPVENLRLDSNTDHDFTVAWDLVAEGKIAMRYLVVINGILTTTTARMDTTIPWPGGSEPVTVTVAAINLLEVQSEWRALVVVPPPPSTHAAPSQSVSTPQSPSPSSSSSVLPECPVPSHSSSAEATPKPAPTPTCTASPSTVTPNSGIASTAPPQQKSQSSTPTALATRNEQLLASIRPN